MAEKKQELAKAPKDKTLRGWMESDQFKVQIAKALPKHLDADRFLRIALTTILRTPKLANCSQESVLNSVLTLSQLGIEADGRRAHLIPYGKDCTLIIDYKGLAELIRRSGDVSMLHADVVCEHDEFDYSFGTGGSLIHKPNLRKERGKVIGAYSYVKLKDGSEDYDVMSVEEIELVRAGSPGKNSPAWKEHWNEMAKKTVFRRHSKWLPLSPEIRDAVEADDDQALTEQERFAASKPAKVEKTTEDPWHGVNIPIPEEEEQKVLEGDTEQASNEPTDHEKLEISIEECDVSIAAFESYLRKKKKLDATETLASLKESDLKYAFDNFDEIITSIKSSK